MVNILDPNREVAANYVAYLVETRSGESLLGILAAETATSVTVRQPFGKDTVVLRSDVRRIESQQLSLMPEGLEEGFEAAGHGGPAGVPYLSFVDQYAPTMSIIELFNSGFGHHQAGRSREAEAVYRQVLSLEPGHSGALQGLAILSFQAGRKSEAIALLREAARINPGAADCQNNLGALLASEKQWDEALAAFERAVALGARFPQTFNNIGSALKELGRLNEAAAAYRNALSLSPDYAEAHNNLATVLLEQGNVQQSLEHSRRSSLLRPDLAEAASTWPRQAALQRHGDSMSTGAVDAFRWQGRLTPARLARRDQQSGERASGVAADRRGGPLLSAGAGHPRRLANLGQPPGRDPGTGRNYFGADLFGAREVEPTARPAAERLASAACESRTEGRGADFGELDSTELVEVSRAAIADWLRISGFQGASRRPARAPGAGRARSLGIRGFLL